MITHKKTRCINLIGGPMTLMETHIKVTGLLKTSHKYFFCDLRVGDIIHIGLDKPIEGRNRRTKFTPHFTVSCDRTDDIGRFGFSTLSQGLVCFNWEKYDSP